jgi:hypothetical protein
MNEQTDTNDRKARAVTAGLSGVGAAAGTAGLAYAAHDVVNARKLAKLPETMRPRVSPKIGWKTKALIPLEVAGLGGELMATHILHGDAKQQKVVKSMSRMNLDPKNGKGRRIVVENAESAEENKEENSVPVTRKKLLAMADDVKNGASMKSEARKESAVGKASQKSLDRRNRSILDSSSYPVGAAVMGVGAPVGAALEGMRNPKHLALAAAGGAATGVGLTAAGRKRFKEKVFQLKSTRGTGVVDKARYFDPEADRQRRVGMYSGVLGGGAVAAGSTAYQMGRGHSEFERLAADKENKIPARYKVKGTKGSLIAGGTAAGLAGLAAATYKHGISRRNQPWN